MVTLKMNPVILLSVAIFIFVTADDLLSSKLNQFPEDGKFEKKSCKILLIATKHKNSRN